MFSSDDFTASLLREATALKDSGDWNAAVERLRLAKARMLTSPVCYGAETWCRLPLYLQQAGRFEEALLEFQFLLDDLPRRARRDAQLDNPSVGPADQKQRFYDRLRADDAQIIEAKRALAEKREAKRLNV